MYDTLQTTSFELITNAGPLKQNVCEEKRGALQALSKPIDVVIKLAEKGGGIVVIGKDKYILEGVSELSNTLFYRHLEGDPTLKHLQQTLD